MMGLVRIIRGQFSRSDNSITITSYRVRQKAGLTQRSEGFRTHTKYSAEQAQAQNLAIRSVSINFHFFLGSFFHQSLGTFHPFSSFYIVHGSFALIHGYLQIALDCSYLDHRYIH
jgi:hypothetical protein